MAQLNERGISSIVKSLQKSNDLTTDIHDAVIDFNPVLKSPIIYDVIDNLVPYMGITATALSDIATATENILEKVSALVNVFTGTKMQDEENRREMVEALSNLGAGGSPGNIPPPLPRADDDDGPGFLMQLGIAASIIAGMGAVAGFFAEMFSFLKVFKPILNIITKPLVWLTKNVAKVFTTTANVFNRITAVFKGLLAANRYTKPITDLLTYISSTTKSLGIIKTITSFFQDIVSAISKFSKVFSWGFKLGGMLAKVFKGLAWPLLVILAAYETIKGAIAGFKEGGLVGALKGGLTGLLSSLVGETLDMIKGAISWIAKILGFENVSNALDSFSFSKLLKDGVDAIFGAVSYAWDYVKELFSLEKMKEAWETGGIAGFLGLIWGGLFDMIKGAISWIATLFGAFDVSQALDNFSFQDLFNNVITSAKEWLGNIFDAITQFFSDPKGSLDKVFGGGVGDMIEDAYKKILRAFLPDPNGSKRNPLTWVAKAIPNAIYKWADAPSAKEEKADATFKRGFGTPDSNAQFADDAFLNDYINKKKMEPVPSNAGATLNQSSTGLGNAPVIINNMGGNVTNTSSSSVSNTSSAFEPIMTGSAMGFVSL